MQTAHEIHEPHESTTESILVFAYSVCLAGKNNLCDLMSLWQET